MNKVKVLRKTETAPSSQLLLEGNLLYNNGAGLEVYTPILSLEYTDATLSETFEKAVQEMQDGDFIVVD